MTADTEPSLGRGSEEISNKRRGRTISWLGHALVSMAVAACALGLGYLYFAVPGAWVSGRSAQHFNGTQMTLARGKGGVAGTQMVIQSTDAAGIAIVSVEPLAIPASEYRRIRWTFSGAQSGVVLTTLWRTDSGAGKIAASPLELIGEGAEVLLTPGERGWTSRVEGIALAVNGTLQQPLVVNGVSLAPMDAADVLADRIHDWFGFSPWTGMSINTAVGGPLEQSVRLPIAAAIVALTAIGFCAGWRRHERADSAAQFSLTVLAIVGFMWLVLDARWLWGRLLQTEATAGTFSGKAPRDKHIADLDGYLYAFAEQVRSRLPTSPARVYVTADEHYFGARMAYHLLPHNAYVDHGGGKLPQSTVYKPGDYIVVFGRKNVRYDLDKRMLSWDDQPPIGADLLLMHRGNAMFKLR